MEIWAALIAGMAFGGAVSLTTARVLARRAERPTGMTRQQVEQRLDRVSKAL